MEQLELQIERYLRDPEVGEGVLDPTFAGDVCENIRSGLRLLGYRVSTGRRYDGKLRDAVLRFQQDEDHRNKDGLFGPGTRRRLAQVLARKIGWRAISELSDLPGDVVPSVFISYARADSAKVDKVDQWLLDRGIRVRRDIRDFYPGQQLPDAIKDAIVSVDKVIVVHSENSLDKEWTKYELGVAETREQSGEVRNFIIYLVLDDSPLPTHDQHRIAVIGTGKTLLEVGEQLLRGILGTRARVPRIAFDENELL
jgi:hypothetical protein